MNGQAAQEKFRLSRIYAQGWKAASRRGGTAARRAIGMINPYPFEPERERWDDGFRDAHLPWAGAAQ